MPALRFPALLLWVLGAFALAACTPEEGLPPGPESSFEAPVEEEEEETCEECDAGPDGGEEPDAGDAGCYPPEQEFYEEVTCGDAGTDAGADAGEDAGGDAGTDGGSDAGTDGGWDSGTPWDSGTDAGSDAGADAGWDAGRDAGADAGWDAGSWDAGGGGGSWGDAGTDGGADAGAGLDGGLALHSALQAATPPAPTDVLDTTPVTPAQLTNDYENKRMKERCGLCEVRPEGPIDPNKVPYILVHGINAGPDSMNPVINNLPDNAQVYHFYYPDNRHPMEVSDCLRNAIMQVRQQHRGSTLEVVAHSLGTVIATGADHSLADPEWMPTQVDTTCGTMQVRGRHRKGFVLEPAPGPGQLNLGMTLIEPIFQGYGDYPLFISNCMPGRGDLIAGSALMQTLNRKPRHSRNRRIIYADDPRDGTSKHLGDFSNNDLALICRMLAGERVRSRNFEMFNAWNALKNQRVGNGQTLLEALGCGGCNPDRLRQLAGQAIEKRPGNHNSVLGNVPFPP